jgi:hypothetical protein
MVGLPTSTLEDEIKAIDLCIKAKIKVPEFFVYQPYPKTKLGEYCVENKLFDGDLSKMKMYGFSHPSLLNCFTNKEKNSQRNVALLGPIAVRHPFLKKIITKRLIHKPTKKLFEKIYTIEKQMTFPFKVYKMDYSPKELLDIFKRALKLEKTKRN